MSFLRPVKMVKVGLAGLKDDREVLLGVLHDLNVAQVEPISKETLEHVQPERGSDLQRTVGDLLIRFRGLKTALPKTTVGSPRSFANLEEVLEAAKSVTVDEEVGTLKREEDRLLTERKQISDEVVLLERHPYYEGRLEYLSGPHVVTFMGEAPPELFERLRSELPPDAHLLTGSVGDAVAFLTVVPTRDAETVGRLAQKLHVTLTAAPRLTGTRTEALAELTRRRQEIDRRLDEIRTQLTEISRRWAPTVLAIEEALSIENRKLEVYSKLGAGQRTFVLEGWIPRRERAALEMIVNDVTSGRAFVYDLPTSEEPPTLMENPPGVRWFEFFIRFYSLPQATEWDPTWVFAVVFPIFFGFMLGDWGYGLVILGISLWMIAGFPGSRHLPSFLRTFPKKIMGPAGMRSLAYTLVPACLAAIVAGVIFNEFFGAHVLPTPSVEPISKAGATLLLLLAGYIGLAMVTFGFLLGTIKEYVHHHTRGVLAKVGGIAFAWGIALTGLGLIRHQEVFPAFSAIRANAGAAFGSWAQSAPVNTVAFTAALVGLVLMLGSEGLRTGLLGLIEIVSHILSYTRLVGILLASVVLTLVGFKVAGGLQATYGVGGLLAGAAIVVIIQLFNIILGVFEPGIQGARLIFVENFSKYFSGNGKAFRPFGSRRSHTLAQPRPPPPPAATSHS